MFKVPSNSVRRFWFSAGDPSCKRELSFLSHPHLQGWLRSNKSKCSIWEFWLWSPSKQSCRRTIVLIRISRVVLGRMNMAVWWNTLIFRWVLCLYEAFGPYEAFGLRFVFFTWGVMMTFTWRFSRHLLGTQIFCIGEPFLQLVPTYLANTSPFWFLNSL